MAYSDYGGYAYRNAVRVPERSDAVITDEARSVPGMYPGFAFLAQTLDPERAVRLVQENPNGHAVIGDSPLHIGLYKTSGVSAWVEGRELALPPLGQNLKPGDLHEHDGEGYVRTHDIAVENGQAPDPVDWRRIVFALPLNARLEVVWVEEDNFYVYAHLAQEDGTHWHAFSGYGVGAGLEDADYGYSTPERERTLRELWPDAPWHRSRDRA